LRYVNQKARSQPLPCRNRLAHDGALYDSPSLTWTVKTMKICIFGAGAIGGYMGAKLAQAGAEVSLVARLRAPGSSGHGFR
jgi:pyruvate/2-oxoglutarate dehydrogenase complex dihydrolipoamide dehydrogenase (E3) component